MYRAIMQKITDANDLQTHIAGRAYWMQLADNSPLPALLLTPISTEPVRDQMGAGKGRESLLQIDCLAMQLATAKEISGLLVAELDNPYREVVSGEMLQSVSFLTARPDVLRGKGESVFRIILEFQVNYEEANHER